MHGPKSSVTGILIDEDIKTQTCTKRRPGEDTGRKWLRISKGRKPQEVSNLANTLILDF